MFSFFHSPQCFILHPTSAKLEKIALDGEIDFNELLSALHVKRSTLHNWLNTQKQTYKCVLVDGGSIMASTPGEAGLKLGCFDCADRDSGECQGHGDEKVPDNLVALVSRLQANGIIKREDQARVLEESYGITVTAHEISEIIYRHKNDIPMPEGLLNMEPKPEGGRRK